MLGSVALLVVADGGDDAYRAAMKKARKAFAGNDPASAIAAADAAVQAATEDDVPHRIASAHELAAKTELKRNRPMAAAKRYRRASIAAEGLPRVRQRMLQNRISALTKAGSARKKFVRELVAADARVAAKLKRPSVPKSRVERTLAELESARKVYVRDRDRARALRVQAAKALVLVRSRQVDRGYELAKKVLGKKGASRPYVQQVALDAARRAALSKDDLDSETEFALRLDAANFAHLAPDRRRYRRSGSTRSACRRYEKENGAGSCARLAKKVTGEFSFIDYSRGRSRRTLTPLGVEHAQAQYVPAVEDCLKTAALKEENEDLFLGATITISWSINGKGRADGVEIKPKRYEPIVGECVKERIGWFRYPRSRDGQRPLVSIPFKLGDAPTLTESPRASNLDLRSR